MLFICIQIHFACRWYKFISIIKKSKWSTTCAKSRNGSIISEWFKANKLSLNIDKTSYMLFYASNARPTPQHSFELFIKSFKVKRVESCKFLGIYLYDTSSSAITEGPREALVSRNPASTKRLTWKPYRVVLFAWFYV